MTNRELIAYKKAYQGYIDNAFEEDSAFWADNMTVADIKGAAISHADSSWPDYL